MEFCEWGSNILFSNYKEQTSILIESLEYYVSKYLGINKIMTLIR